MLIAKELGARSLLVKSESLLVTVQVTDEYQAKDPQLASYLRYVRILRLAFSAFDLVHVPREQNSQANLLSKLASSGKGGWERQVIQETLKSPRTAVEGLSEVDHLEVLGTSSRKGRRHRSMIQETLKVPGISTHGLLGDESLEILYVDTIETWITTYKCYLADRLLPIGPTEAKIAKRNAGQYILIGGNLFRHGYTHSILTCVSGDPCTRIMAELHEGVCGSHIGGQAISMLYVLF